MKLNDRIKQPTPKFWKKVRNFGVFIATICGSVLASGVDLPPVLNQVVVVAGAVGTAVAGTSTLTVRSDE